MIRSYQIKSSLILLFFSLIPLIGCLKQNACLYQFNKVEAGTYKLFFSKDGYETIPRDDLGNFIISFIDTNIIYTSTAFDDISNTISLYSIKNKTDFISDEELEKLYKIKITNNLVGKSFTTDEGYMIPDHIEIVIVENN